RWAATSAAPPILRLTDPLLVELAVRVRPVVPERRDEPEARPLVQADRLGLVDPRLEPQDRHVPAACVIGQTVEQQGAESSPTERRADVHPFELAVLAAEELHAP